MSHLAESTPTLAMFWIAAIAIASVGANIATIILAIAAFRKQRTEVSFGFVPASKEAFEEHAREVWKEINELKRENLAMTRAIGEMSSRILADLANAKALKQDG